MIIGFLGRSCCPPVVARNTLVAGKACTTSLSLAERGITRPPSSDKHLDSSSPRRLSHLFVLAFRVQPCLVSCYPLCLRQASRRWKCRLLRSLDSKLDMKFGLH